MPFLIATCEAPGYTRTVKNSFVDVTGDRIVNISISMEHMVYEDALTILSYASAYPVVIRLRKAPPPTLASRSPQQHQRQDGGPISPSEEVFRTLTIARLHPRFRSQSLDDLRFTLQTEAAAAAARGRGQATATTASGGGVGGRPASATTARERRIYSLGSSYFAGTASSLSTWEADIEDVQRHFDAALGDVQENFDDDDDDTSRGGFGGGDADGVRDFGREDDGVGYGSGKGDDISTRSSAFPLFESTSTVGVDPAHRFDYTDLTKVVSDADDSCCYDEGYCFRSGCRGGGGGSAGGITGGVEFEKSTSLKDILLLDGSASFSDRQTIRSLARQRKSVSETNLKRKRFRRDDCGCRSQHLESAARTGNAPPSVRATLSAGSDVLLENKSNYRHSEEDSINLDDLVLEEGGGATTSTSYSSTNPFTQRRRRDEDALAVSVHISTSTEESSSDEDDVNQRLVLESFGLEMVNQNVGGGCSINNTDDTFESNTESDLCQHNDVNQTVVCDVINPIIVECIEDDHVRQAHRLDCNDIITHVDLDDDGHTQSEEEDFGYGTGFVIQTERPSLEQVVQLVHLSSTFGDGAEGTFAADNETVTYPKPCVDNSRKLIDYVAGDRELRDPDSCCDPLECYSGDSGDRAGDDNPNHPGNELSDLSA